MNPDDAPPHLQLELIEPQCDSKQCSQHQHVSLVHFYQQLDNHSCDEGLNKKQHCTSLVIDLLKVFDTVDHDILKLGLFQSGLLEQAVALFTNYLSNRAVHKGVPQCPDLGPLLFIIISVINGLCSDANMHFYADDSYLLL